mgnify:CR=1 FL=1
MKLNKITGLLAGALLVMGGVTFQAPEAAQAAMTKKIRRGG